MSLITAEEKIECLKNLLSDPDDWISLRILELADEDDKEEQNNSPLGINETSPLSTNRSSRVK